MSHDFSNQVSAIIKDLLPQLQDEIQKELTEKFDQQLKVSKAKVSETIKEEAKTDLENALLELQNETLEIIKQKQTEVEAAERTLEAYKQKYREQIQSEISQHYCDKFENEKKQLFNEVAMSMNQSKMLVRLEVKIRQDVNSEHQQRFQEEYNKKIRLLRLNLQMKTEQNIEQAREHLMENFNDKLRSKLDGIDQRRTMIQQELQLEQEKILKIEQDRKLFKEDKQNQEQSYQQLIQQLQMKVDDLKSSLFKEQNFLEENFKSKQQKGKMLANICIDQKRQGKTSNSRQTPKQHQQSMKKLPNDTTHNNEKTEVIKQRSPHAKIMKNKLEQDQQGSQQLLDTFNLIDFSAPPEILDDQRVLLRPKASQIQIKEQQPTSMIEHKPQIQSNAKLEIVPNNSSVEISAYKTYIIDRLENLCKEKLQMKNTFRKSANFDRLDTDHQATKKLTLNDIDQMSSPQQSEVPQSIVEQIYRPFLNYKV